MWMRKRRIAPIYNIIAERMQYLYELNTPLRQRVNTPTIHWIKLVIDDNTSIHTTPYFAQDAFLQHLFKEFELVYDLQFFWPIEPMMS